MEDDHVALLGKAFVLTGKILAQMLEFLQIVRLCRWLLPKRRSAPKPSTVSLGDLSAEIQNFRAELLPMKATIDEIAENVRQINAFHLAIRGILSQGTTTMNGTK